MYITDRFSLLLHLKLRPLTAAEEPQTWLFNHTLTLQMHERENFVLPPGCHQSPVCKMSVSLSLVKVHFEWKKAYYITTYFSCLPGISEQLWILFIFIYAKKVELIYWCHPWILYLVSLSGKPLFIFYFLDVGGWSLFVYWCKHILSLMTVRRCELLFTLKRSWEYLIKISWLELDCALYFFNCRHMKRFHLKNLTINAEEES